MNMRRVLLAAGTVCVIVCAAVAVVGFVANDAGAASAVSQMRPIRYMGASLLDDDTFEGVELATATQMANGSIVLPDEKGNGGVQKVLVDETPGLAKEEIGVAIKYGNGLKFYFKPLPLEELPDFEEMLDAPSSAPFVDGRAQAFEIMEISGVEVAYQCGGIQEGEHWDVYTPPSVEWNTDQGTYTLSSEQLGGEALLGIARGLINGGARAH